MIFHKILSSDLYCTKIQILRKNIIKIQNNMLYKLNRIGENLVGTIIKG